MKMEYALVTPARNEEATIEKTIQSVVAQTVVPRKWVIVSDGSTDRTDEIAKRYALDHPWIEVIRMPERRDRQFAAKVHCFNAGYQKVKDLSVDVIGNLDADVSFERDHMEFLLRKFEEMPELGVAGTPFIENGYSSMTDSFEGERHVAGQCQLFRAKCFEEIGGYVAHKAGGIDWIAVTTARMKGWKTISFREKTFFHHRTLGTGGSSRLGALFDYGMKDYYLGNHPLWEILRLGYRAAKKPVVIGSIALGLGYGWAALIRMKRPVSEELVQFHRGEQLQKLRAIANRLLKLQKIDQFRLGS